MAYYTGSEAVRLDGAQRAYEAPRTAPRSFEVIEGSGLDARVREGVGASFFAHLRLIALVAGVLLALGTVRVSVSSATVSILKENATMRAGIKTAQSTRADLEVQRSVLSAGTRIDRIATHKYLALPLFLCGYQGYVHPHGCCHLTRKEACL